MSFDKIFDLTAAQLECILIFTYPTPPAATTKAFRSLHFFTQVPGGVFVFHTVVYRAQNLLTMPTVGHSQCLRLASSSEWHHDFSSDVGRLIACRHHRHATTRRIQYPSLMPHAISFFGELCRAPCAVHYYKLSPYTRYFLF